MIVSPLTNNENKIGESEYTLWKDCVYCAVFHIHVKNNFFFFYEKSPQGS